MWAIEDLVNSCAFFSNYEERILRGGHANAFQEKDREGTESG